MSLSSDYQKLGPDNVVRLFDVGNIVLGASDILRFHAHNIAHTADEIAAVSGDENKLPIKSIWWQGHEYKAWPCQIKGTEAVIGGTNAQPTLPVVSLDSPITTLCLAYSDLLQTGVTIHDMLTQYLDAKSCLEDNPSADPQQEKLKVSYIDTKSIETNEVMAFTLPDLMDPQGLMIPTCQLYSLCTWCIHNKYRFGDGYGYAGIRYFDKHSDPVNDPSFDECLGTFTTRELGHGERNELPFGDFPGTSLTRNWHASEDYRRHHGTHYC